MKNLTIRIKKGTYGKEQTTKVPRLLNEEIKANMESALKRAPQNQASVRLDKGHKHVTIEWKPARYHKRSISVYEVVDGRLDHTHKSRPYGRKTPKEKLLEIIREYENKGYEMTHLVITQDSSVKPYHQIILTAK